MKTINLNTIYPFVTEDCYINVPDEVAELIAESEHAELAYWRKAFRNKAYFSLDRNDGIETEMLYPPLSADKEYEQKIMLRHLYSALNSLTEKQAKRIYAYFFLGLSKAEIARSEGVNESKIRKSINLALQKMEEYLKKFL